MYAIIRTGGKQWRVSQGDLIRVEHIHGQVGKQVRFDEVLFVGNGNEIRVGTPLVPKAHVVATITEQGKAGKVLVYKYKRRKKYRRTRGHRQLFTQVRIEKIEFAALLEKKIKEQESKRAKEQKKETKTGIRKPVPKKETKAEAKKPSGKQVSKSTRTQVKKEASEPAKKPVKTKETASRARTRSSKTGTQKKKG